MTNNKIISALIFAGIFASSAYAVAEETEAEKLETTTNKAADTVKRTYRNAKDEICEMIDGKANCAVKKVINKVKNTADKIETTATEAKNKAD